MKRPAAYVDDQAYPIAEGETIYTFVSRHLGEETIPVLCNDDALEPFGNCRLCSVDVALSASGPRRVKAACHTLVEAGQYIYTATPRIEKLRHSILELLLSDYPPDARQPLPGEKPTAFQTLVQQSGISRSPLSN